MKTIAPASRTIRPRAVRRGRVRHIVVAISVTATSLAAADFLPKCTIDFDGPCPNASPLCGASFIGGLGCVFEALPFCYSSGLLSYKITPTTPLTIDFAGDVISLDLFFVNVTGSSGTMRFFDADGAEIDEPLTTNGNCMAFMPRHQVVVFSSAIRSAEVTAVGGTVWIDTMTVNPIIPKTPGDLNGDGVVDGADLGILLTMWGPCDDCDACDADLNGDCIVDGADLGILLTNWS